MELLIALFQLGLMVAVGFFVFSVVLHVLIYAVAGIIILIVSVFNKLRGE